MNEVVAMVLVGLFVGWLLSGKGGGPERLMLELGTLVVGLAAWQLVPAPPDVEALPGLVRWVYAPYSWLAACALWVIASLNWSLGLTSTVDRAKSAIMSLVYFVMVRACGWLFVISQQPGGEPVEMTTTQWGVSGSIAVVLICLGLFVDRKLEQGRVRTLARRGQETKRSLPGDVRRLEARARSGAYAGSRSGNQTLH